MSLEKVIVEYGAELKEIKQQFADLKKQMQGVEDQAKQSGKKTEQALNDVSTNVKGKLTEAFNTLGKAIIGAFAIQRIGAFITSTMRLATEAEELKSAFDKLNNPTLLMNLRKAVDGTLSDLKLMGIALKANNLQIPLANLAKILEYAKIQADSLGKSTQEVAETIIQGIGTKSTRALVQVGISQQQFSTEVKKTGDYYTALNSIIDDTLENAGEQLDSTADKQERLNAEIENTKVKIGNGLKPLMNDFLKLVNAGIKGFEKLAKIIESIFNPHIATDDFLNKEAKKRFEEFKGIVDASGDSIENITYLTDAYVRKLRTQQDEMKSAVLLGTASEHGTKLQVDQIDKLIDYIKKYSQSLIEAKNPIEGNTDDIEVNTEAIKKENDEFEESIRLMTLSTQAREALTAALVKFGQAMGEAGIQIETVTNEVEGQGGAAREAATGVGEMTEAFVDNRTELEKQLEAIDIWGSAFLSVIDSVNQYYSNSSQYRTDLLQDELKRGIISQGQYDREIRDMKIKEAKREKAAGIFHIVISTAEAIMAALAQANPFLAVAAGITGATQLGVVASKPIPAFKKGGEIKGKEQIIRVNEEGTEFIAHARATRKHKGLLDAINRDRVDEYILKAYTKEKKDAQISWDDYRLLLAIKQGNSITEKGFNTLAKNFNRNTARF